MESTAVGLLGGTFDPIHFGHLIAAEYACHEFGLERLLLIPAGIPPHKLEQRLSGWEHRLRMTELAVKNNPLLEVCSVEMEREGNSYTIDTLRYFKRIYPDWDIYFIIGADALFLMNTWKEPEQLAYMARFIVVTRPGYDLDKNDPRLRALPLILREKLSVLQIPGLDISSSDIRRRIAQGKPIKYLLPAAVEDYVGRQGLYREH